jgi:hypothetical protein
MMRDIARDCQNCQKTPELETFAVIQKNCQSRGLLDFQFRRRLAVMAILAILDFLAIQRNNHR